MFGLSCTFSISDNSATLYFADHRRDESRKLHDYCYSRSRLNGQLLVEKRHTYGETESSQSHPSNEVVRCAKENASEQLSTYRPPRELALRNEPSASFDSSIFKESHETSSIEYQQVKTCFEICMECK